MAIFAERTSHIYEKGSQNLKYYFQFKVIITWLWIFKTWLKVSFLLNPRISDGYWNVNPKHTSHLEIFHKIVEIFGERMSHVYGEGSQNFKYYQLENNNYMIVDI